MAPTETTKKHVIRNYIEPARQRGEKTVTVHVGTVLKELGWTNRTPSVFSTLSSQTFHREAHVELIGKNDGPSSGGPSTTWRFVDDLTNENGRQLDADAMHSENRNAISLLDLFGIFKDGYKEFGGSDAWLEQERDWGPDVWERYEAEKNNKAEDEK